jgi:hypothetical protein
MELRDLKRWKAQIETGITLYSLKLGNFYRSLKEKRKPEETLEMDIGLEEYCPYYYMNKEAE